MQTLACLLSVVLLVACSSDFERGAEDFDARALQYAGLSGHAIRQLRALGLDGEEVEQVIAAKGAGMAEQNLVALCRIYRDREQRFTKGKAVVALRNAGTRDETILELAERELLDGWVTDVVAMRYAGFSDGGILELADLRRRRGKSLPSGATLARLKHTGLSEEAIIRLVEKGLEAADVAAIEEMRRKGKDEKEIVRAFKPKPR